MAKLTKMGLFSKYTMCFTADLHLINILGKNLWGLPYEEGGDARRLA